MLVAGCWLQPWIWISRISKSLQQAVQAAAADDMRVSGRGVGRAENRKQPVVSPLSAQAHVIMIPGSTVSNFASRIGGYPSIRALPDVRHCRWDASMHGKRNLKLKPFKLLLQWPNENEATLKRGDQNHPAGRLKFQPNFGHHTAAVDPPMPPCLDGRRKMAGDETSRRRFVT